MMYKDQIKELNKWFRKHKDYGTYHHTKQVHGEDVYCVSQYDIDKFNDYLRENEPDLIGIPCMVGGGGIWFTSEDLENARYY